MVRIIIEIDGTEVAGTAISSPGISVARPTSPSGTPEQAAAQVATDAGPAAGVFAPIGMADSSAPAPEVTNAGPAPAGEAEPME